MNVWCNQGSVNGLSILQIVSKGCLLCIVGWFGALYVVYVPLTCTHTVVRVVAWFSIVVTIEMSCLVVSCLRTG